jgi:hypothetical protein
MKQRSQCLWLCTYAQILDEVIEDAQPFTISYMLLEVPELIMMFRIRWPGDVPSGNPLVITGGIEPCTISFDSSR